MECDVTNYHTRYTLTQLYDEKKKSRDWTSLMFKSNAKLVVNMLSCEFEWCVLNWIWPLLWSIKNVLNKGVGTFADYALSLLVWSDVGCSDHQLIQWNCPSETKPSSWLLTLGWITTCVKCCLVHVFNNNNTLRCTATGFSTSNSWCPRPNGNWATQTASDNNTNNKHLIAHWHPWPNGN